MTQHVTEPTRYRQGEQPNLLDLILTNDEGMVQNLTYHPGLGDSDHCCLKFDLNCYVHRMTKKSMNYYKANYRAIRNKLRKVNWDEILNGDFTDDYTKFLRKIELATAGNIREQTSQKKKKKIIYNGSSIVIEKQKTTSLETLHKNKRSL